MWANLIAPSPSWSPCRVSCRLWLPFPCSTFGCQSSDVPNPIYFPWVNLTLICLCSLSHVFLSLRAIPSKHLHLPMHFSFFDKIFCQCTQLRFMSQWVMCTDFNYLATGKAIWELCLLKLLVATLATVLSFKKTMPWNYLFHFASIFSITHWIVWICVSTNSMCKRQIVWMTYGFKYICRCISACSFFLSNPLGQQRCS